jgi:hypothetical protein
MKGLSFGLYAFCTSVAAASLVGCGASSTMPQSSAAALATEARSLQPGHGSSWMAKGAKDTKALL